MTDEQDEEDHAGILLLADLRHAFRRGNRTVIESEILVAELQHLDERPWSAYGKHLKPITPRQVAWLLKPFGIRPDQHWLDSRKVRGYALDECDDSFRRYLAPASADDLDEAEPVAEDQDDELPF